MSRLKLILIDVDKFLSCGLETKRRATKGEESPVEQYDARNKTLLAFKARSWKSISLLAYWDKIVL